MATTQIVLPCGAITVVDADRAESVRGYPWRLRKTSPKDRYVACNVYCDGVRSSLYLHRFLMNAPAGIEVDHRDGDRLNNRIDNLRLATTSQNQANKAKSHGRGRYKGVYRVADPSYKNKQWRAELHKDKRRVFCAYFATEDDAARAYDAAALAHFGEFAKPNFPIEGA